MRLSIVYDDNGTILSASLDGEDTRKPVFGPGASIADFDVPDHLANDELRETVEHLLVEMDPRGLTQRPARKESDDGPF
jgi:hypothetical protein